MKAREWCRIKVVYTDGTTGTHPQLYGTRAGARTAAKRLETTSGIKSTTIVADS